MNIMPLVLLPDPLLRTVSRPVEGVDDRIRRLADDMIATMYDAPGIGLAGIQVGVPLRLFVLDISRDEEARDPRVFVNPQIVQRSDETALHEEGCLSIPEYYAEVERPARLTVQALDRDGQPFELEADGLLARVIQHEYDHLDGVLFIDHLSKLKRDMVVRKFRKLAREKEKAGPAAI